MTYTYTASKTTWMVKNNFGPIEGQNITKLYIPSTIDTEKGLLRTANWVVIKSELVSGRLG